MARAKIEINPPFDMKLSLKFATACRFESEADCAEGRFHRIVNIAGTPVLLTITTAGPIEKPTGTVEWSFPEGGVVDKKEVLKLARHIISSSLDLGPFYNLASKSGRLQSVINRFRGLKPILTPSVYESAAWAIMGQQVNLNFAYTLKMRITKEYGRIISINGRDYSLFPEPERFLKATVSQLRGMQFSNRKAEYLLGLSKTITEGNLELEKLGGLNYNEALNDLLAIRGIGIWSANYILMRGAGHADCLPLGDSGLHRAVKNMYKLKNNPTHEKVEKLAGPFAPYRSLYTLYMWYSLLDE